MAVRHHEQDIDIDKLREQVAQLQVDFEAVTKSLKELGSNGLGFGLESARDAALEVRDKAKSAVDAVTQTIEQRPLSSALVLFGLGILIGNLIHRRS